MRFKRYTFPLAVIVSGLLIAITFYWGPRILVNGSRVHSMEMTRYTDSLSKVRMNEPAQTVAADSQPRSATLSIRTEPSEAHVIIESDSIGRSPIDNYSTQAGVLFLTLEKPGYAPLDTIVIAEADRHLRASFELEPRNTEPSEVDAGNESSAGDPGQTPSNGGSTAEAAEEEPASAASGAANGAESSGVTGTSPPPAAEAGGTVRATSTPSEASFWMDGQHLGTTPIQLSEVEPGIHRISLEKSGYEPLHTTVRVERGSTETVNATLTRATGTFSVLVKPWGSIYIDGQLHEPDTDLQYTTELPAGEHQLRVVHPNLGIWEQSVEIDAGARRDLVIDLTQVDTRQPE